MNFPKIGALLGTPAPPEPKHESLGTRCVRLNAENRLLRLKVEELQTKYEVLAAKYAELS